MKSSHTSIVKTIVELLRNNASNKITLQRVANAPSGNRYVQILTSLGVVTIRDTGALTEPDYEISDIGDPKEWSKVSKGVVVSKTSTPAPFTTAQNAGLLGEYEIAAAESLLDSTTGLAPVQVITHPGLQVVYADSPGVAIWTFDPAGGALLTNHTGQWTRNAESVTGVYALIKPWIKAVVYSMPKDPSTGYPQKISGISFGTVGTRVGIHIVCKDLNMVIGCTGAVCPKDSPSSYMLDGKLKCFSLQSDSTFIQQEEEFEMKANLIDLSALQQKPQQVTPEPAIPAEPVKPEPEVVPQATQSEPMPVAAPTQEIAVTSAEESQPEKTPVEEITKAVETVESVSESPAPEPETVATPINTAESEAQLTVEELLNNSIEALEAAIKGAREILTTLKACRKQHKSESKDTKATQKLQAENSKLREELAEIKAKASAQEATLNKFKALLG